MAEEDEKDPTWPEELVEIEMNTSFDSQPQNVRRSFKQEDDACPEEVTGKEKRYFVSGIIIKQKQGTKIPHYMTFCFHKRTL